MRSLPWRALATGTALLASRRRRGLRPKNMPALPSEQHRGVVGNVYKGRVSKVLPGMHDSALKQLRWLAALLPVQGKHKSLRAALQKLKTEIESA